MVRKGDNICWFISICWFYNYIKNYCLKI